nr:sterol desaturase family protein [Thalassotalea marina]
MPVELILLVLSPIFLLFVVIEYYFNSAAYRIKDTLNNALLALLHQASDAVALLLLMPFFNWLHQFALLDIKLNWLTLAFAFIAQDFLYYWFHRASHTVHWLWAAHVVHHSSTYMNFSTAFRQSVMYPIVGMWLFWLPLVLIGFEPQLVFAIVAINLAFQFFVHTRWVKSLGILDYIFNTPSHHRVHHATNSEYIDKNFAGVLIIWDKLFGTFVAERADLTTKFGIVGQLPKANPISTNFHQWQHMITEVSKQPSWRGRFKVVFGYPSHKNK